MGYFLMQTVGTALISYFIQYTILREVQQIVFMGQRSNNLSPLGACRIHITLLTYFVEKIISEIKN